MSGSTSDVLHSYGWIAGSGEGRGPHGCLSLYRDI